MKSLPITLAACLGLTAIAQAENKFEEIVVTSSRVEVPLRQVGASVSVIDAEEIQLRGYSNLADVLRTQPGVGVSNSGGAGKASTLRIRGEEGYRTLVRIDGIEVSDPTATQVISHVQHILASSDIERVEILRGPQGMMYGADAGGVVNIFTPRGETGLSGQLSAEGGRYGTRQLEGYLSGGTDKTDVFVSLSDFETDGFNARVSDTTQRDDDGYDNTTLHARLGVEPVDNLRLQLVARDVNGESAFDGCGFPSTNDCTADYDQQTWKVSGEYGIGRFNHTLAYAETEVERNNSAAGFSSFDTNGEILRTEYLGSAKFGESVTLVYGVDLEEEAIVRTGGEQLERDQLGYYLEYQGSLAEQVFFTAGVRRDDNDDFGKHTSYRLTTAYIQSLPGDATLKYRASYGTGFRAPSLSEIAYNQGPFAFGPAAGLALTEESSEGYDLGIEYLGSSGLYLELVYFNQDVEDEIFFDLVNFFGYFQATGISESTGIEVNAEYPVGNHWILSGNFTYNDTETPDGFQRTRRPEQLANLGVRYISTDDRLKLNANLRMSRDAVDEIFGLGRIPLEDYEVLDLSASYQWSERFEIHGRIENALDEDYQEITGFNTSGAAAYAGVRFTF